MQTDPEWTITAPGVRALAGTQFTIRYERHEFFRIFWGDEDRGARGSFAFAEKAIMHMIDEMMLMGLEP